MKIAIPSTGQSLTSEICISFGRTEFFILVDSDTLEYSVIKNTAADAPGGAGIQAAQILVDNGAEVVISLHCGKNAADVLKPAGIKILRGTSGTIQSQVEAFKRGELEELVQIHPGYHGGGKTQ